MLASSRAQYILTDLTAGMGATKRPEDSNCHVAPLHLLFGDVEQPVRCPSLRSNLRRTASRSPGSLPLLSPPSAQLRVAALALATRAGVVGCHVASRLLRARTAVGLYSLGRSLCSHPSVRSRS